MIITIPRVNAVATIFLSFVFSGCGVNESVSPLLASEPEENSITERVARTIRLYFKSLPDVDQSNISLIGPSGDYTLRGLHTICLLYTSPSPRDRTRSRMPSSA